MMENKYQINSVPKEQSARIYPLKVTLLSAKGADMILSSERFIHTLLILDQFEMKVIHWT